MLPRYDGCCCRLRDSAMLFAAYLRQPVFHVFAMRYAPRDIGTPKSERIYHDTDHAARRYAHADAAFRYEARLRGDSMRLYCCLIDCDAHTAEQQRLRDARGSRQRAVAVRCC